MANYTIEVNFNDNQSGENGYKSNFSMPAEALDSAGGQSLGASIFGIVEKGLGAFAGVTILKETVKLATQVFSYEVQRVERYTGSQQAQDVANATLNIIGMLKNPFESAIAYSYETEKNLYERQWESIGLQLYRERGGASLNRSRSEV